MKVLLLAGTAEARILAQMLADAGINATASLAGVTRHPAPLAIPHRSGGFGGEAAQELYLRQQGFHAILDATHPFASKISKRTAHLAAKLGLAYVNLTRPEWRPEPADKWTSIKAASEAVDHIAIGATVLLATGRQTLESFANLEGRCVYCRVIDPPKTDFPFSQGGFLVGKPPFSVEQEIALFESQAIDCLVVKNAGGAGGMAKLIAARRLGLPVIMIARPNNAGKAPVPTPEAAFAWLQNVEGRVSPNPKKEN